MAGKMRLEGENLKIAMKILKDVGQVLNKADIHYWLEGGTLLGVIREQRLLPWDNDMDISMFKTDQGKLFSVVLKLISKGYRISIKRYRSTIGPFNKGELRMIKVRNYKAFLRKGEVLCDIFLKRKVEDEYYWTVGVKTPVLKSTPAEYYEKVTRVPFDGMEFSVPLDYDGYLTYRYGDWRKTVKTWNFKKDDRAIVKN